MFTDKQIASFILMVFTVFGLNAQDQACVTFDESPRGEEALDAYSIYTQAMKTKEWNLALEQWRISYEIAPAADGKRDHNYTKGVEILVNQFEQETDDAKKKEILAEIERLYDEAFECYRAGKIEVPGCKGEHCVDMRIGHLKGEYAYHMYYKLRTPYSKNLKMVNESLEMSGDKALYTIFVPAADVVVYQFDKDKITAEEARAMYAKLEAVYDANIETSQYKEYYQQGWDYAKSKFGAIAGRIFDCEYFKNEFKPQYEANPEDPELLKTIIARLKAQDCDPNDPFLVEVDTKWKKYAEVENARLRAEFEAKNPSVAAKRLYDEGNYGEAIAKYDEAIAQEEDAEKKASYLFSKASIQFRKLKQYSTARATARESAKLPPNWGRPHYC